MKYAVLATWKMAEEGTKKTARMLAEGKSSAEAIVEGIAMVEDNPDFHSVGYGGRPNAEGRVFFDGGFMNGDTLHFGAIGSLEGFRSAVRIAASLQDGDANNFLVGEGAERYAAAHGFERRDNVTPEARQLYEQEKEPMGKCYTLAELQLCKKHLGDEDGRKKCLDELEQLLPKQSTDVQRYVRRKIELADSLK